MMKLTRYCPCKITEIEVRLPSKNVSAPYIAKIQNFDPLNNFPAQKVDPIKRCKIKRACPIYPWEQNVISIIFMSDDQFGALDNFHV